jgi:MFS family permease
MVAKLFPPQQRGTFLGLQGSALNVLFSVGAILSGIILVRLDSPLDFTLCFLIASALLVVSYGCLALTKEIPSPQQPVHTGKKAFLAGLAAILKKDKNFGWFLVGRIMTQFASMASAFYIIYAVRHFQMDEATAGLMTGVLATCQIAANPLLGWLGDHLGHRILLGLGALCTGLSALVALSAPALGWFYLIFILLGIGNVASWTIAMSITMEFSGEAERPAYIGLANTLIAPAALAAPLFGGWMADQAGYSTTFATAAGFGLVTMLIFFLLLRDPRHIQGQNVSSEPAAALED